MVTGLQSRSSMVGAGSTFAPDAVHTTFSWLWEVGQLVPLIPGCHTGNGILPRIELPVQWKEWVHRERLTSSSSVLDGLVRDSLPVYYFLALVVPLHRD